ncbi:membrane protein insertion efficiency factor YidD, partial [Dysosmobacter welbionis]
RRDAVRSTLRLLILRMGLFPITSSSSSHAKKLRSVLAWVTMLPSFSPRSDSPARYRRTSSAVISSGGLSAY